jgi:signal transduction protein with GAF and PtsI domain
MDLRRSDEHLRNIQALTDTALGRLEVEDLLIELLDRVCEMLNADTAAILLLDEGSQELVARAARGIEEEVYQGVRIPLRMGFAGRIAAERRPVALDRIDETTVANPILWEKGIRSMLGVPLVATGRVIGVLHAGTLEARQFT